MVTVCLCDVTMAVVEAMLSWLEQRHLISHTALTSHGRIYTQKYHSKSIVIVRFEAKNKNKSVF